MTITVTATVPVKVVVKVKVKVKVKVTESEYMVCEIVVSGCNDDLVSVCEKDFRMSQISAMRSGVVWCGAVWCGVVFIV